MTLESFEERALSATLAQFDAGQFHDSDFAAFRAFPASSVNVILDVGANRGQSIASFRTVFAQASIHAFEANPVFFNVLAELAARLPGPLHVHRYGLGRERASLRFHIPWVGDVAYLEESSTRVDYFEKPWVVDNYRQRGTLRLEEIIVDIRAGDEFGLRPDIVKIDVEGAEHDVLVGLRQTIEATQPFLLVENSDWHNVTPLLRELDYEPYRWEPTEQTLVPYYGATTNTFYVHSGRLVEVPVR
jgi:FkbM family methyltransferase